MGGAAGFRGGAEAGRGLEVASEHAAEEEELLQDEEHDRGPGYVTFDAPAQYEGCCGEDLKKKHMFVL